VGWPPGQQATVQPQRFLDHPVDPKPVADHGASLGAQAGGQGGVGQQAAHGVGKRFRVAGWDEDSAAPDQDLGNDAHRRVHHRAAVRQALEHSVRHALRQRGEHRERALVQQSGHIGHRAEKLDVPFDPVLAGTNPQ
jgi:hypothetical protein